MLTPAFHARILSDIHSRAVSLLASFPVVGSWAQREFMQVMVLREYMASPAMLAHVAPFPVHFMVPTCELCGADLERDARTGWRHVDTGRFWCGAFGTAAAKPSRSNLAPYGVTFSDTERRAISLM